LGEALESAGDFLYGNRISRAIDARCLMRCVTLGAFDGHRRPSSALRSLEREHHRAHAFELAVTVYVPGVAPAVNVTWALPSFRRSWSQA